MTKDLVAYESAHEIDVNYKKFSVVLKDKSGSVFRVLNAFTAFAEIYVDDIWIDTVHRGKGFGKKLLQELEAISKEKDSKFNISLSDSRYKEVLPGLFLHFLTVFYIWTFS